jgi:hypothetical protein
MINDPQNAWRILNQANPGTMANKLFVMEWYIPRGIFPPPGI